MHVLLRSRLVEVESEPETDDDQSQDDLVAEHGETIEQDEELRLHILGYQNYFTKSDP